MKITAAQTDAWNIARGKNPQKPSVLRFRPSLQDSLGDESYPQRLMIVWQYKAPDSYGMPSEIQSADMKAFEDTLIETLDPDRLAVLAFVFTSAGSREWHFYLSDLDEVGIRINKAIAKIPQLPIELTVEHDPEWNELRQVYQLCAVGC